MHTKDQDDIPADHHRMENRDKTLADRAGASPKQARHEAQRRRDDFTCISSAVVGISA